MLKGVKNSSPGCVTPRVPFGVLPSAGPWASAARTRVNAELQTDGSQRLAGPALIVLGFVSIPRRIFLCGFTWIYPVLGGFTWIQVDLCGFEWIEMHVFRSGNPRKST
jgi:hypothetical protein